MSWGMYSDAVQKFIMSVEGPYHSGWYDVLVEILAEVDIKPTLATIEASLKSRGYYRPRDKWVWSTSNVTYMKTHSSYYQIKVRKGDGKNGMS
jgi:hypothetical protein